MPCRRNAFLLAAALFFAAAPLHAQMPQPGDGLSAKPALDHDVYDIWNRIAGQALSDNGQYALYHLVSEKNDPRLIVRPLRGGAPIEVERAEGARFSEDGRFIVFLLKPAKAAVEEAKKNKVKDEDIP